MLLGHTSFASRTMLLDAEPTESAPDADRPVKHLLIHTAINRHLSQSIGAGAFDGQHGMSLAISSIGADEDESSAIVDIETPEDVSAITCAMTARDSGANANPAITTIASNGRMVIWRLTALKSHKRA